MRARYFLLLVIFFLFFRSFAHAQRIHLNNGRVIDGNIIEQDHEQVRIEVRGITLTYYIDEISHIEGQASLPETSAEEAEMSITLPQAQESLSPIPSAAWPQEIILPATSGPQPSMSKRELILKYMQVTGVQGQMRKSFSEIIQNAPVEQRNHLSRILNVEDVIEELIPIYDRYFTDSELKELIEFYQSNLGQKLILTAPLILKESMEKSLEFFQDKIN